MARLLSKTGVFLTCLVLQQIYVSGTNNCTSPFQVTSNNPQTCYLMVPSTVEAPESFCESFEEDPAIFRLSSIYYSEDMNICYFYLTFVLNEEAPLEGCCGGGLPGR